MHSATQVAADSATKAPISFRPLHRADFPLLQTWLATPHVEAWWHERLDLIQLETKYGPRIDGQEPAHVFIIEHNLRPIGWIQWYRWSDYPKHAGQLNPPAGAAGIDIAIGDPAMIGLGWGPAIIQHFLQQVVLADPTVTGALADPEQANTRSWRAFQKAGFSLANTVQLAGENCQRIIVRFDRHPGS